MANSDKNIKITPNISQTAQPNVVFTGQGNIPITLKVLDDSYGTLSFEGTAGQLFSVNNNLTSGVIFSVNDVSGIPQFDVNADGTIRLAPYGTMLYVGGISGSAVTIQPATRGSTGAGANLALEAGDGVTTGAGGSVILQPGAQATSGGDGVVQIKTSGGTNSGKFQGSNGDLKIMPESGKNVLIYDGYNGGGTNVIFQTNQSGSEPRVNMAYGVSINSFNFISGSVYASNYAGLTSWNLNLGFRSTGAGYTVQSGITGGSVGVLNVTEGDFSAGGSIAFKSSSPSGYSANQNDLALTGSAFQRLSGTAARDITGVAPPSGGSHVDGRMLRIYNVGSFNLTLKHNSTSSTAANRFFCIQSVDIIVSANDFAELIYDSTNNGSGAAGWRVA